MLCVANKNTKSESYSQLVIEEYSSIARCALPTKILNLKAIPSYRLFSDEIYDAVRCQQKY